MALGSMQSGSTLRRILHIATPLSKIWNSDSSSGFIGILSWQSGSSANNWLITLANVALSSRE